MNLAAIPRRPSRADDTIGRLREQITTGAWPVGSRIPTEPELVVQLGVARNTVREAVRALTHTGLLEVRQGSGTYVVATSELAAVMHRRFGDTDVRDLNEFRAALEGTAAALAAQRRTEADLKRVEVALRRRNAAWRTGDADAFADVDAAFHLSVVAAAHNEVLSVVYADLADVIRAVIRADLDALGRDRPVDHDQLVDAIRSRDADRARAEASAHAHSWRPPR